MADLVDQVVASPPGPELSAVLGALPWGEVPNARLIEVLQARARQLAHEQAELFAGIVEISHAVAVSDLPGSHGEAVRRAEEQFAWASHEIAAGLTLTPTTADRELMFATALVERLPLVFGSLRQGRIDRSKARVFVDYLDPANGELTEEQSQWLCERFVPQAPRLTTRQLSDRLYRALHAIDPDLRRRRYQRAVQERGVALYLDPRTGTATLVGDGLPPHEAAAAAERIDRMVEATKRAGHPGRRAQISADLYLGMLNGEFHGRTEMEIIGRLVVMSQPEDNPDTDATDDTRADDGGTGDESTLAEAAADDTEPADDTERDAARTADEIRTGDDTEQVDTVAAAEAADETGDDPGECTGPGGTSASAPAENTDRWAADRVATREGIEIRVGLATLAGLDDRPGEIPGLGPVGAHIARSAVAAQRRGASWKFAIVDASGYLLLAGPLRRRPRTHRDGTGSGRVRGGVVELHCTLDELQRYATDPVLGDWHEVLAEITARWADRHALRRRLAARPHVRFARGPLADHIRIRDRNCCGPGCTRSARRSDLDHTRDHALGGRTVDDNIGPGCTRHHPDKDRGWSLTQPRPGHFRWLSPLGRVYHTRGEPVRPELPDPAPHPDQDTDTEADQRLRRDDPRIPERLAEDTSQPPPPGPDPPPDNQPSPF